MLEKLRLLNAQKLLLDREVRVDAADDLHPAFVNLAEDQILDLSPLGNTDDEVGRETHRAINDRAWRARSGRML